MMLPIVDAVAEAINDEHAEKQQMAPLAEGEEEGGGVNKAIKDGGSTAVLPPNNKQKDHQSN